MTRPSAARKWPRKALARSRRDPQQLTVDEFMQKRTGAAETAPAVVSPEKLEAMMLANIKARHAKPGGATFANCAAIDGTSFRDCMKALGRLTDAGLITCQIVGRVANYAPTGAKQGPMGSQ